MSATADSSVAAPPQGKIDPSLIVPFVSSVREVFRTMVGVEAKVDRPVVKQHPLAMHDVSAIVQFGGNIRGSVVLSFEADAAVKLVEKFAGAVFDINDEDFADAVGELANMVAGAAKKNLACEATIGIPSVVVGSGHQLSRLKDVPTLVVPCRTESGDFAVEISISAAISSPAQGE